MKTKSALIISLRVAGVLAASFALFLVGSASSKSSRPPQPQQTLPNEIVDVKCVLGLETMGPGTVGTFTVVPAGIQFKTTSKIANIPTASITDMFTGTETRQDISGMVGTGMKAAVPYGGGRVLSLFSHGVEVLTVEYTDDNGGLHGAIFVFGKGKATDVKNRLVAQGAKSATHLEVPDAPPAPAEPPAKKEEKP